MPDYLHFDPVPILFENDRQLVCIKEPGLLSEDHPSLPCLPALLKQHTDTSVYPVHRLDKETGGVMVYAKTPQEAARLSKIIQEGNMVKEYLAVLCGEPQDDAGEWEDLLFHDRTKNKTYTVKRERRGVKPASLAYQKLDTKTGHTLVQIRLYTGRTHQIRAQSAARKMPLLGDRRYGGEAAPSLGLWAFRLTLPGGHIFTALPPCEGVWLPFADSLKTLKLNF